MIVEIDEISGKPLRDNTARAEIELLKKKALTFKVVAELPTEDIQENTIYLKPTGQTGSNKYTAHLYVNGEWEDFETIVEFDASQYAKILTAGTGKNYDFVVCLFDGLGKQSGRELATTLVAMDKPYTIPVYWANTVFDANQIPKAVIPVGTPVYAGHAANKKYVDDRTTGRNLLRDSNVNVTNAIYNIVKIKLTEKPTAGEKYTITMKATLGEDRIGFSAYNSGGLVPLTDLSPVLGTDLFTSTFTWRNIDANGNTVADDEVYIYQFASNATSASTIEWIKLEKGSTFTCWTPAPEDFADIGAALDSILTIQNKLIGGNS